MARMAILAILTATLGCAVIEGEEGRVPEQPTAQKPAGNLNPEYAWWSAFRPGAWVVLSECSEEESPEVFEREIRMELKELDRDRAVVEIRTAVPRLTSGEIETRTREILARVPAVEQPVLIEGLEKIQTAGRMFECRLYRRLVREGSPDVPIEHKELERFWVSDEVPGGVVRMTYKPENLIQPTRIRTLVSFGPGGRVEQGP